MSELIDILKTTAPIVVAITGLLVALHKFVTGLDSFQDRPFKQRNFKRLEMLERESGNNPAILEMLALARSEDVYRALFGWHATPASIDAMLALLRTRQFAIADLKAAHTYMRVENGRVTVTLGTGAWIVFWFFSVVTILLAIYIAVLFTALLSVPTMESALAMLAIAIMFVFHCWYVGPEIRAVIIGRRLHKKLAAMTT